MALYHHKTKLVQRSKGRSSVAAAAYRSGERIVDQRTGLTHDYTRRKAEIESWIAAPEGAPEWSRSELWNAVEAKENRKNSRTAREIEVALPAELDESQQRELVEGYVAEHVTSRGLVADVAIHRDKRENPHAHILMATREITPQGFGEKDRGIDKEATLEQWRGGWADHTNEHLREAGSPERVDHRSNEARGIDKEPTVHEGPAVRGMEDRGISTAKGALNRERRHRNEGRDRQPEPRREPQPSPSRGRGRSRQSEHDNEPERDI